MKVRNGFVSNSSSSSFVCDVCGTSYSGYDGMYEDTNCCTCCKGHEICSDCSTLIDMAIAPLLEDYDKATKVLGLTNSEVNELMGESDKKAWIKEYACDDEINSGVCPVCNLIHIDPSIEAQYLLEKFNLDHDNILNEIREKFGTLDGWHNRSKK